MTAIEGAVVVSRARGDTLALDQVGRELEAAIEAARALLAADGRLALAAMQPEINVFGLSIKTFGLFFALNFVAWGALVSRRLREIGKPVGLGLRDGGGGARRRPDRRARLLAGAEPRVLQPRATCSAAAG